jgi:hypothetical protein
MPRCTRVGKTHQKGRIFCTDDLRGTAKYRLAQGLPSSDGAAVFLYGDRPVSGSRLNILDFSSPSIRTLHLSLVAFFISFVLWFSHAPLLILNVALTIPSRIVTGKAVDRFSPRLICSGLLMVSAPLCWGFAFADRYQQLVLFRFLG